MDIERPISRQAYQDFITERWILPSQDSLSRGYAIVPRTKLDICHYFPESLEFYKHALFIGDYIMAKFYHSILLGRFLGSGKPLLQRVNRQEYHHTYTDYILTQMVGLSENPDVRIIVWAPVISFDYSQELTREQFLGYYNGRGWHPISYEKDGVILQNHFPRKWVRTGVMGDKENDLVTHEPTADVEEPKAENLSIFTRRRKRAQRLTS